MKKGNYIRFELVDNTNLNEYNGSCEMKKTWFGLKEGAGVITMEDYYYYCREFAAAMGFAEKTINEWFGDY